MTSLNKRAIMVMVDEWRNYLKNGNGDIFEMIKRAITVAASDEPAEFLIKRDEIAQTLFSCQLINSSDQENKQSMKVYDQHMHYRDTISNSVHEEDQKTKMDAQVLKIKEILDKSCGHESESAVYEWLLKLEEMGLCFKTLEATGIGRSVSAFQNHASTDIRQIARRLIKKWRGVVDEWINATENTSSVVQEDKVKEKEKEMVSVGMKKKIKIIRRNSEKAKMEEMSIEEKLEATKRKLHQRYEEAEKAKRQRKIQVIEPHQLNKQGLIIPKCKNQIRKLMG